MTVRPKDINKINYINIVMKDIGGLTDTIYESLMDEDTKTLNKSVEALKELLDNLHS